MIEESYRALLAKLLANENIQVQVRSVQTASFAPKERILTLPNWSNLDPDISDLFTGHEVGHALFTPTDFCQIISHHFAHIPFSIFNIVEDIRIERMIQGKYPGLIRVFESAYGKLVSSNFFNVSPENVDDMNFIDRLNFHEKTWEAITFSHEEQNLVTKAERCVTAWDVYRVSEEIFQFLKSKKEEKSKQKPDSSKASSGKNQDSEPESSEKETDSQCEDNSKESEGGADSGDSGELDKDSVEDDKLEEIDISKKDEFISETSKAEEQNRAAMTSSSKIIEKFNVIRSTLSSLVIETNNIKVFLQKHKTKIDNLTCQFLMKQAAYGYTRQSIHVSGVVDDKRLYRYQFDDVIFKSMEVTREEKNHGLVFLLDFSSSMTGILQHVIEKTLILAAFCDNVKIPYRIYSFTTGSTYNCSIKLLCDSLKKNNRLNQNIILNWQKANISLGGTPLVEALFSIIDDLNDFRRETKVSIVNFILLSDGDGTSVSSGDTYSHDGKIIKIGKTATDQQTAAVKYITHLGYRTMCIFVDSDTYTSSMKKDYRGFQRYFTIPGNMERQMISDSLSHKVSENKYFTFFVKEFSNFIS